MAFIRRVRTPSGATGVQIAEYVGDRRQRIVRYVGSAHTPAELGVVMARARQLLAKYERPGQGGLDLGLGPRRTAAPVAKTWARSGAEV